MRWIVVFVLAVLAKTTFGSQSSPDPALLAPLDEAVGLTKEERASAFGLMKAMLQIQHAYLVDGHTVPKPLADYDGCLAPYGRKLDRSERRAFIRHSLLCHREVLVAPRGQSEIDVEDIRLRQLERRILNEMEP
jgi:hypothetical protein